MTILSPQYVAGFFDGEGCVNLTVKGACKQVSLRVMIVNTDPLILDLLRIQYGGRTPAPRIHQDGWKGFRQLVLTDSKAINFLQEIAPFVIIKRPQIELALEFWRFQHLPRMQRCDLVRVGPAHRRGHCPNKIVRKPETIQKELEFKAKMHLLNKRGA